MIHAAWPVDPSVVLPFAIAVTLVELTPGPNMGYLAMLSATEGRAAGIRAVAGVTLGLTVYMLAAVVGVAELIAAAPALYGALRWAGVAYLFYLAWEAWRSAAETSPGHAQVRGAGPFWRGLTANLLNPKAAVFYVTLMPGFIAPDHAAYWVQALALGTIHICISLIVHGAIVFGAAHAGAMLANTQRMDAVRKTSAVIIAAIAVWLAWETRR